MFNSDLEFIAEEWTRLAAEKAEPLGLPDALLAREFLVRGMSLLTRQSAAQLRQVISEEMLKANLI